MNVARTLRHDFPLHIPVMSVSCFFGCRKPLVLPACWGIILLPWCCAGLVIVWIPDQTVSLDDRETSSEAAAGKKCLHPTFSPHFWACKPGRNRWEGNKIDIQSLSSFLVGHSGDHCGNAVQDVGVILFFFQESLVVLGL